GNAQSGDSASAELTIDPGTKLVFAQQPTATMVNALINPAAAVQVEDANGNVVTTDTSEVSVALTAPNGAVLSGTTKVAVGNGKATFVDLSVDKPGVYTLTATDGSLTSAVSDFFTVAGAATKLAFTVQPVNTVSGAGINVAVSVEDANGTVVMSDSSNVT